MIEFTKENTFLIEFQPGESTGKVTTYISNPSEDSKLYKREGLKVLRVCDTNHKVITSYNAKTDFTDLTYFLKMKDFYFVSVMLSKYNEFKWIKFKMDALEKVPYDKIQWLYIREQKECSSVEINLLNKWFPDYFAKMVELTKKELSN